MCGSQERLETVEKSGRKFSLFALNLTIHENISDMAGHTMSNKKQKSEFKRVSLATGGGSFITNLLPNYEDEVLETMAAVAIEGHRDVKESMKDFTFLNIEDEVAVLPTASSIVEIPKGSGCAGIPTSSCAGIRTYSCAGISTSSCAEITLKNLAQKFQHFVVP